MPEIAARCLWCGAIGTGGVPCARCGVPVAPPLDAAPITDCPRCQAPLAVMMAAPGVAVHACAECCGVFVPAYAWSRIAAEPALADAIDEGIAPRMPRRALVAMLRCPACRREMERGPFGATSRVTIDVCPRNHGLWLDASELPEMLLHMAAAPPPGAAVYAAPDPMRIRDGVNLEVAKIRADSSQRMAKAKQAAVLLAVLVLAIRIGIGVMRAKARQNARRQTLDVPESHL